MVSSDGENPVYDIRLSSVVPARVTGEDKVHELTNMDLVMKLHYIRGLYFFKSEAVQGLDISDLKEPMFHWLDLYYPTSGRIRQSENGRPFIKCNDSGVRIVEARCSKTLDEWVAMKDHSLNDQLIYNQVLGPDLGFSPLVFIQFTWFKCGGFSVGLSWAHILGDIFSASTFINRWGQIIEGHIPSQSLNMPNTRKYEIPPSITEKPFPLKRVDPVGDYWLTANNCKMETHSFYVTAKQLDHVLSKTFGLSKAAKVPPFQFLSALMWKSLAKVRGELEPRIVTICNNNPQCRENEIPSNSQVISIVEADFKVMNANLSELVTLIAEKRVDERKMIEEMAERENGNGKSDYMMYGANLTFVNLEEANIYGLELKGHKAMFANYYIAGIGDEGVVLVLPGPDNANRGGRNGRTLTVTLPGNQISELKDELRKELGIF